MKSTTLFLCSDLWTKPFSLLISCFLCALQRNFDLCIPRKGTARPQSQFPHSCVCERFIYSHDRYTNFSAAEYADRSGEYINRTQKHVCRNWAVPFLGIHVSNFRYSIFAVWIIRQDFVQNFMFIDFEKLL